MTALQSLSHTASASTGPLAARSAWHPGQATADAPVRCDSRLGGYAYSSHLIGNPPLKPSDYLLHLSWHTSVCLFVRGKMSHSLC